MKSISLTQGKFALVDDDMFEYLNQWKWHYSGGYAKRMATVDLMILLKRRKPTTQRRVNILEGLLF